MKIFITTLFILLIIITAPILSAVEVDGIHFDDTYTYREGKSLKLNGAGFLKRAWIKIYGNALYLTKKSTSWKKIVDSDKPMAMRMHILWGRMTKKRLVKALKNGFQYSTARDKKILAKLHARIEKFATFFNEEPEKYDTSTFLYIPGEGTHINIRGKYKGLIPGLDFKKYLFNIWLGTNPADLDLRKQLLGN